MHPGFQIQLAHILVEMIKKLDIIIYINPFIIEALEVYSKSQGIEEDVNFFLSQIADDNFTSVNINQIRCDDLKVLYDDLSNPFRIISNIRFEREINNLD